ncbi:type II toxin-antitoxin system RelB family antitoxin [Dialister invisus]|uniref:type II toxin-antitoxin system RelB family antitoxin n=1 Tax=Dialister invisus TaxID=218538 RepID=UPI0035221A83
MSSVISVRINEKEAEILNQAAAIYGCAVSSLLKRLALEKLEDEYDMQVIKKYEEERRKGKVKIYPIEELFEELDV